MSEAEAKRSPHDVDPRLTTFDFDTPVDDWSEDEIRRLFTVLAEQEHMSISEPLQRAGWGDQS